MVMITWLADRLDTPMKVGRTPSITQGWRPVSARIQPSSAASQGSGMMTTARRRNQRGTGRLMLTK